LRLILDTHVAIWFSEDSSQLSERANAALDDPDNILLLSAVVPWEISIKRSLRRLQATDAYLELLTAGARALPVTIAHAKAVEQLPRHHGDPFDRLLIAQAQLEDAAIVTADERIGRYDVTIVW
jgi:PIN domain nuclease of toxin-antitoxin system